MSETKSLAESFLRPVPVPASDTPIAKWPFDNHSDELVRMLFSPGSEANDGHPTNTGEQQHVQTHGHEQLTTSTYSSRKMTTLAARIVALKLNYTREQRARLLRESKAAENRLYVSKRRSRRKLRRAERQVCEIKRVDEIQIIDLSVESTDGDILQAPVYVEEGSDAVAEWSCSVPEALIDPELLGRDAQPDQPGNEVSFPGKIVIQSKKAALAFALNDKRTPSDGHLAFWVDGSFVPRRWMGVGLVFRCGGTYLYPEWARRGYKIEGALERGMHAYHAELIAIWQALNIALDVVPSQPSDGKDAESDARYGRRFIVTIYTDCQSVLIGMRDYVFIKRGHDNSMGLFKAVLDQARLLETCGILIELRWTPGHQSVPGNILADAVAKYAGRYDPEKPQLHATNTAADSTTGQPQEKKSYILPVPKPRHLQAHAASMLLFQTPTFDTPVQTIFEGVAYT